MDTSQFHQDVAVIREIADRLSRSSHELSTQDVHTLAETVTALERCFPGGRAFSRNGEGDPSHTLVNKPAEQEKVLAENRRQKALLDAIFEADPGGVAVVTGPDLRIVQVNPAFRFLIPDPFQDPVGRLYESVWPPESGEWFPEQIRKALETGQPFLATGIRLHLSIGITRTFTFQARRIDWQDEPAVLIILWDTTELEKTNLALRESESKFMAIFQTAPLAIALSRLPNGTLVDVNDAFEKMFGFTKEEVMGRTTAELGIAPDPKAREQILNQFKQQGFVHQLELTYRTRAGETILLSGNVDRVRIGEEEYILNTFENVTERKAAEKQLAVEQEWFRTTLASIGDAVITTDTSGQVTFLNPVAEQLTGWSSANAAGQPLEQVFPIVNELTQEKVENPVEWVLREGFVVGLANHTALITRDGRQIPIEDSAAPIQGENGQTLGVVLVFHDVNEKRKAENALRESEERFRLALKNMPVVVAHLDRDLRYTWVYNPMMGFTASDVIGKEVGLSTDLEEKEKLLKNLKEVVSSGVAAHWEVASKTAAEERFFESYAEPLRRDGNGEISGVAMLSVDITERKDAETAIQQQNRLIELSYEPIFTWDLDHGILTWNQGCEYLYGYSRDEAVGRVSHELMQTQHPMALDGFKGNLLRDGSWTGELRQRTKDGREVIVESRHQLLKVDGRQVVLETNRDITQRKQLEVELIQAHQRAEFLARFPEENPNPVARVSFEQQTILYANPPAASLPGWELAAGQPLPAPFLRPLELAVAKGSEVVEDIRLDNGRYFSVSVIPCSDENYANIYGRDITERREAEELALNYQIKLEAALNSMADAVFISDLQGNFIHINDAFATYHRFKDKEECAKTFAEYPDILNVFFTDGTLAPTEMWAVPRALRGETVTNAEYGLQRKDSGERWIGSYNFAPIRDQAGAIVGSVVVGRDITERRLTEETLKYQSVLLENVNDAIVASNQNYRLTSWNKAAEAMYGWKAEEVLGRIGLEITQTIFPEADKERMLDAIAKKGRWRGEATQVRKDGTIFPVEVSSIVLHNQKGEISGYVSVNRDITERKQAEEKLRAEELTLRSILNATSESVWLFDPDGVILMANETALARMHKPAPEVIGHQFSEFMDAELAQARKVRLQEVIETGQPVEFEDQQAGIHFLHNFCPVIDPLRGTKGAVSFSRDISSRKQAEAQLAAEKEWFRTTLSSIGDAVITTDQQGWVTFLNPVAEQLTGWSSAEAAGHDLKQVFPIINEQTQQPVESPVARVLQEGRIVGMANHTALAARDGRQIPIEDSAAPITDHAGQVQGVVMVFHDVSEKRKSEATIRENQLLLTTILDETPDPVFLKDRDSRILLANQATLDIIGKPREEVLGKNDLEHYDDPEVGRAIIENDRKVMESGQTQVIEERVVIAGKEHIYLSVKTPYRDAAGSVVGVIGLAHDITERKLREDEVQMLNRTLLAHTRSSQAMLYAQDETTYLQDVCRIITEDCGYTMVWIGLAEEDEGKTVRPAAYAGFEAGYLETLGITWADTERGRGPTGTAIRTGKPAMCRNMLSDPQFKPWRAEALKRGYASSLVLPLISGEKAIGAVTIYSREPDGFIEDEGKLLSDLASDLAYGISDLRLRAARVQAEEAMTLSERRYRSLFEEMTEGFALHDILCDEAGQPVDYRFLEINPAFEQLTGLSKERVVGRTVLEVMPGTERYWIETYGRVALTGEPAQFRNYSQELGKHYEVLAFSPQRGQFAVLFIDVTERVRTEEENHRLAVDLEIKRHLIEQREQERLQIARDLHDGPVQELIASTYLLHGLLMEPLAPEILKDLEEVKTTIHKQVTELRAFAMELRPPILAKMGLESTIRSHLESYRSRHPELEIQFEAQQDNDDILPEEMRVTLFRIYQESLNNAARHSRATQIAVQFSKTDRQAVVEIRDNGIGFEMPGDWLTLARQGHLGLVGMRERIQAVGGRLELESEPGKGLVVRAIIPLARD